MKLSHYLLLGVSALFALLLAGAEYMYVAGTRDYLQQQLEAHAQETATSLALSIGSSPAPSDTTLVETIVNPVFDRGQFGRIEIVSSAGQVLVSKRLEMADAGVPSWFVRLFPIEAPGGQALISAGWRQLGRVTVATRPALAYAHLWQATLHTVAWLVVFYVVSLLGLLAFLAVILRALAEIESAARDLGDRKFRTIDITPRARELRNVVAAFNLLSGKIRSAIEEELARAGFFRREAYNDPLTGLLNRRGFEQQMLAQFETGSRVGSGLFAMIGLDGLAEYNASQGFRKADELIREAAAALGDEPGVLRGRLNGSTLVVFQPNVGASDARDTLSGVVRAVGTAVAAAGAAGTIGVHAGAVRFEGIDQGFGKLLAAADEALGRARAAGAGAIDISDNGAAIVDGRGAGEWRRLIEEALAARRLSLYAQPVIGLPARTALHTEINARLDEAAGPPTVARLFVPMALRHKLGARLDTAVMDLALDRIAAQPGEGKFALNISGQGIHDAAFVEHVRRCLMAAPALASRLVFETTEAGLLEDPAAAQGFADAVRALGAQFALDNFLVHADSLKRLEALLPHYIKLSATFTGDLARSAEARFLVSSLVRITSPLDIPVIAQGVEEEATIDLLVKLGVSGVQGYAIGRPQPW